PDDQPDGLEPRLNDLLGGARECRALEHAELALMEVGHKALERSDDEGDIRFLALSERGGDADDEGVGLPDLIEGGGGGELSLGDQGGEGPGAHTDTDGAAAIQLAARLQKVVVAVSCPWATRGERVSVATSTR